ncbi:MAG: GntP family permease, partial [Verrucomicrobiae bacterium]|nr:GntP family permease [Verrucomicrobiae bacterium]
VRSALAVVGEARAGAAFVISGFVLGIPVFFDTVFYLMIPLGKALRLRTGGNYTLYVLTIVVGATMAHSLVPPTPGPLLVADRLHVAIGTMMLGGILVGLLTVAVGYAFAVVANRWVDLPLRDSAEASLAELEAVARRPASELPPLWLAAMPIALPVALIAG